MISTTTRTGLGLAAALTASSAFAQFTYVASPPGNELGHAAILSNALGESVSRSGKWDFIGESVSAIRTGGDAVWDAGTYRATMLARQAGYRHHFGTLQDGDFDKLLKSTNIGSSTTVSMDDEFSWAIQNYKRNGGARYSSNPADNWNKRDHMVTYTLYENNRKTGYAVFFEDIGGKHSDRDFNDVAVGLTIVPTPQAALLGLAGLGGMGVLAGRRRNAPTV
ncbi:MAG: DUF4114 domain-containing protein [Planctomycetota bacterium]